MGEAKRRKKLDLNYGKPENFIPPDDVWEEKDFDTLSPEGTEILK